MASAKRRWTLNGDFMRLPPNGIRRYAQQVTAAIDALAAEHHPFTEDLELTVVAPRDPEILGLEKIAREHLAEFDKPRIPQFWVQAQLPRRVRGGLVSFCNLGPVSVRRQIVCIHDLHTFETPKSYGFAFRMVHRLVLPVLGRRAGFITTVSSLAREHLIARRVAAPARIHVTYGGADHTLRWSPEGTRLSWPERPFVLCLGREQPYKNTELFWKLMPLLTECGIDLVMAGDTDRPSVRLRQADMPRSLHLVGRISDDDLAAAMDRALCFALPSRIEGFGLPAVEAMIRGCPVVASTSPCLPEVCAQGAVYADPDDVDGWLRSIVRLRDDPKFRAGLIAKGRKQAARYTWRGVAEIYLGLMARMDHEDSGRD